MGQFAKHIYIQNSAGAIQGVNLYSTAGEAGPWRIRGANVDGQDAFIPCVPYDSTEARRTSAVFTNPHGTWRFATVGTPAYGYTVFWGNGSFTVPEGVVRLRVTCVGGGAGALCYIGSNERNTCAQYNRFNGTNQWLGSGAGGTSSFGGVAAGGAGGNAVYVICRQDCVSDEYGTRCACYTDYTNQTVGGGTYRGGSYGYGFYGGAGAVALTNKDGTVIAHAGAGGGGGDDHHRDTVFVITGSSGYIAANFISVSPGQVIPAYVGGGGGAHDTSGAAYNCQPGAAGAILVEWGQGIQ